MVLPGVQSRFGSKADLFPALPEERIPSAENERLARGQADATGRALREHDATRTPCPIAAVLCYFDRYAAISLNAQNRLLCACRRRSSFLGMSCCA